MTSDEKDNCQIIIHGAAVAAAGVGFVPVPGGDIGPLCAIQGGMVIALARVFGISITKDGAIKMAESFMLGAMGKFIASELVKLIPVLGSLISGTVAASLTEAFGWETAEEFDKQRQNL